jgi:hypothetical protein
LSPHAADLDVDDDETALVRCAVGDYADEAAVLLLITFGRWSPQLQVAGLIAVVSDIESDGMWTQIAGLADAKERGTWSWRNCMIEAQQPHASWTGHRGVGALLFLRGAAWLRHGPRRRPRRGWSIVASG